MKKQVVLPTFAMNSRMLSRSQTAAFLNINLMTLHRLTTHKDPNLRLTSYKLGKARKYKYDEVLYWLENHRG